jgi:hypothetical protein
MLTLDLTNAPRWHDLAPGVRVQLRPLTTALMVATRADPEVEAVPEDEAASRHWCLPLMARDAQNAAHFAI